MMKVMNEFWQERFFGEDRGWLNRWVNWYGLVGLNVFVFVLAMVRNGGVFYTPDSFSYVAASEALSNGELDLLRTPGNAFLLWACKLFAGGFFGELFCVIQEIVFLITVVLLWDMCRMISRSKIFRELVTGFYLLYPVLSYVSYSGILGSDEAGYSLAMIFLWLSIPPLIGNVNGLGKRSLWMTLTAFVAICFRPASMYLLPVMVIYWIVILFVMKRRAVGAALMGFAGVALIVVCLVGYRHAIEKKFGFPGLTAVSYFNNYIGTRQFGLLRAKHVEDPVLRAKVDSLVNERPQTNDVYLLWNEISLLRENDENYVSMNEAVNRAMMDNPAMTAKALCKRVEESASEPILEFGTPLQLNRVLLTFTPRFSDVYLFMLLFFPLLLVMRKIRSNAIHGSSGAIERKEMATTAGYPLVWIYLWGVELCNLAVVLVGAYGEWARLTFGGMPALLLMLAPFFRGTWFLRKA